MKYKEVKPTEANLANIIKDDILDRNKKVYRFIQMLYSIQDGCSIALDSRWGSGKTFFVKEVKLVLDCFNNYINFSFKKDFKEEDIKEKFSSIDMNFFDRVSSNPTYAIYYDSWINDNDIDPILSIIAQIIKNTDMRFTENSKTNIIEKGTAIFDFITGRSIANVFDKFKKNDSLKEINEQKDLDEMISEFLDVLPIEKGNRLVIFIDELDRCKPDYAIKLLERIKHYFDNDKITFVFSVNIEELTSSIKKFYGESFDACRYLDRFFDLRMSLPAVDMDEYYEHIGLNNNSDNYFDNSCCQVAKRYDFTLRECQRYQRLVEISGHSMRKKVQNSVFAFNRESNGLCLYTICPFLIGLRMNSIDKYNRLVSGSDSSEFIDFFVNGKEYCYNVDLFLNANEMFNEENNLIQEYRGSEDSQKKFKLQDRVEELYNALFKMNSNNNKYVTIGQMCIDDKTRNFLRNTENLLSDYAEFGL